MTRRLENVQPGLFSGWGSDKAVTFGSTLAVTGATTLGTVSAGALTVTSLVNSGTSTGAKLSVVDQTTATVTLTAAQSGAVILLDKTDGVTVTLPAPVVGLHFTFLYVVDQASSATVIVTDAGTTFVKGGINVMVVNSATSRAFVGNGSSHVKVTSNATTTGGLAGGSLTARCVSATQWSIDGQLVGSSTPATPFST